ncbi:MAG TPA: tRNA (adenosine(37)-N6)-threonylcarbamoyltransferase complex dimerization subunit type 1 TsaB [Chloroflexota bacterium]|nr:tRNA (adenosine(37)-N6)-threonylcarbamoyltransferase complex dimerization subunit type 1 TsaB [Chloroflexota bacterium]
MLASAPLLLALDTSTSTASVALFDGQRVLSETTWRAGREHSTRVLLEVQAALARVSLAPESLTGVVVARGPGSFTGVRVALSLAMGISAGLSLPVWGVSSLDALAHAADEEVVPVRAVLEAGRGRFATGLYLNGRGIEDQRLATLEQLDELTQTPTRIIGELAEAARTRLEQNVNARLAPPAACLRRSGFLAELGWRAALSGDPGDPRALDALYVS